MNPRTGESSAILTPTVNTAYMNEHLRHISEQVTCTGDARHVGLVLDQAGWHLNTIDLHFPLGLIRLRDVRRT